MGREPSIVTATPMSARQLPLRGRADELRAIATEFCAGRSVLLVGPEAIGKSALAREVATADLLLFDPFQRVGRLDAKRLRHRLDEGNIALATARTRDRRQIGAVGRVLWRFTTLRIGPLAPNWIRQIVLDVFRHEGLSTPRLSASWWGEALTAADGRPGYAVAIAGATARAVRAAVPSLSPPLIVIDHRIAEMSRRRDRSRGVTAFQT